jgi:hypothetical protein
MKGQAYKHYEDVSTYSRLVRDFSALTEGKQDEFDKLLSYDAFLTKKTKEFTALYGEYASAMILCKISFGPETKISVEKIMLNQKWWDQDVDIPVLVAAMGKEFYLNN